eukprot:6173976-Pleurochrysis_carterae.AAC.4
MLGRSSGSASGCNHSGLFLSRSSQAKQSSNLSDTLQHFQSDFALANRSEANYTIYVRLLSRSAQKLALSLSAGRLTVCKFAQPTPDQGRCHVRCRCLQRSSERRFGSRLQKGRRPSSKVPVASPPADVALEAHAARDCA